MTRDSGCRLGDLGYGDDAGIGLSPDGIGHLPPTIVANLDRAQRLFPDRELLTAPEATVSYAEFAQLVEGAAAWLNDQGLGPGDVAGSADTPVDRRLARSRTL